MSCVHYIFGNYGEMINDFENKCFNVKVVKTGSGSSTAKRSAISLSVMGH